MEQEKLIKEIKALRKDIKKMKTGQNEGTVISVLALFIAVGLAFFLYSSNLLNDALNISAAPWMAWLGIIVGLGIMLAPAFIINNLQKRK